MSKSICSYKGHGFNFYTFSHSLGDLQTTNIEQVEHLGDL